MYILEQDQGVLRVVYEGDIPARRAVVTLYSENGQILQQGQVDQDGFFYFTPEEKAKRAEARDGLGHLAVHILGNRKERSPFYLRALLGVFIFLFMAIFSWLLAARGEVQVKKR